MKRCTKCKQKKKFSEFHRRGKGYQSWCKACKRAHDKKRHGRTIPRVTEKAKSNLTYVHNYLRSHPCVDCGESDIVVLQFDHVRGKKRGNVSSMAKDGKPLKQVKYEIEKCDVRCASCHVRKTAHEQGWYKTRVGNSGEVV